MTIDDEKIKGPGIDKQEYLKSEEMMYPQQYKIIQGAKFPYSPSQKFVKYLLRNRTMMIINNNDNNIYIYISIIYMQHI